MKTITFQGGPLGTLKPRRTIQVFVSEGPDTVNKPDTVDRTIRRAAYVLTSEDPPIYTYVPKLVAMNGLCEPVE